MNGNLSADPEVAYRYAKGLPVIHPYNRTRVQIQTPLDFLVISDHAEFYGGLRDIYNQGIQDENAGPIDRLMYWYAEGVIRDAIDEESGAELFVDQLPQTGEPYAAAEAWTEQGNEQTLPGAEQSAQNAWARLRKAAEDHYAPGEFTTLLGWEWSSTPGGANMHRVVLTDASGEQAGKFIPFSSVDSPYPEDLWQWMQETSARIEAQFIAIPHNSNLSKGIMFSPLNLRQEPIDAEHASQRRRFEPVTEITQIKGDSETHPSLSPKDTFADFEPFNFYLQQDPTSEYVAAPGDFVRPAMLAGLRLQRDIGVNPFRFGVIGSTDSHTSLASAEEPNFWGKMAFDSVPERKQAGALGSGPSGWTMQAAGLAAVWAEENTREAIVAAFQRREVYATTGPRIRLRFSASAGGQQVQMGGEVSALEASPMFDIQAQRDPNSGGLDRVQMIKGWIDTEGKTHERIFNLVWSGDRERAADGTVAAVADTVDRSTGQWDRSQGANELSISWQDPEFDPTALAFYYVRVLEVPTPRHALLDAIAMGLEAPTEGPSVIQERAYSSAIWYHPTQAIPAEE